MRLRRALLASVALHGAAWIALSAIPEPPARVPTELQYAEVDLIELTQAQLPAQPQPDARSTQPTPPRPRSEPAAAGEPPATDPGRRRSPRRHSPDPKPAPPPPASDGGDEPDATPPVDAPGSQPPIDDAPPHAEPAASGAAPGALALSGLRSTRRDAAASTRGQGVLAPKLDHGARRSVGRATPGADDGQVDTPAEAGFVVQDDGRMIYTDPQLGAQWTAELLPDGRLKFEDHLQAHADPNAGAIRYGTIGDRIRHKQGFRMWIQHKKRLLVRTRALRLKMAIAFAEKNIERQLKLLDRDLLKIWTSNKPPHTRRGLIFAVWDDCVEGIEVDLGEFTDAEAARVDQLRQAAGEQARGQIIAFIARHIPADGADAYTAAEVTAMNRRRQSTEPFEPYRTL